MLCPLTSIQIVLAKNNQRIQGKKREVGNGIPDNGSYIKGDIVWNDNPVPSGYVGWICTRSGTPGDWKAFGLIQD